MSHECEECGEEFDSERGLHIHQSQKHPDGNQEESSSEKSGTTESQEVEKQQTEGIHFTAKQFGGMTFSFGLLLGVIIGGLAMGVAGPAESLTGDGNVDLPPADTEGDSPSGSAVVELSSAEYPYGDLEAGVGSENRTIGNKTFVLDGEPYIGSSDAEVTAVSFEDFECPFCKQYNENAYPQIVENYMQTGEVQYFYKNLPLPRLHPWAEPSALASECALNQDAEAFWTFKQGFFDNQEALGNAYNSGNFDKSMYRWAEQTGLDTEQFKQCYDNEEEMSEVNQDSQQAGSLGAQATPTIFINDQMLEGAQPYSRFQSTIESELQ